MVFHHSFENYFVKTGGFFLPPKNGCETKQNMKLWPIVLSAICVGWFCWWHQEFACTSRQQQEEWKGHRYQAIRSSNNRYSQPVGVNDPPLLSMNWSLEQSSNIIKQKHLHHIIPCKAYHENECKCMNINQYMISWWLGCQPFNCVTYIRIANTALSKRDIFLRKP